MFITLEGMDGSGKSTAIKPIKEFLEAKGFEVVLTREPGGEAIAEEIRKVILSNKSVGIDGWTEALLFIAARKEHIVKVVKPALDRGAIVISDRFMDSTSAYQGNARGVGIDAVDEVQKIVLGNCTPDLTLFYDLDPNEAEKRMDNRNETKNRLDQEKEDFKAKVLEGYKLLISKYPNRIKVIDANQSIEQVQIQTQEIILGFLNNEKNRSNK